jgi:hypothetical protein
LSVAALAASRIKLARSNAEDIVRPLRDEAVAEQLCQLSAPASL